MSHAIDVYLVGTDVHYRCFEPGCKWGYKRPVTSYPGGTTPAKIEPVEVAIASFAAHHEPLAR